MRCSSECIHSYVRSSCEVNVDGHGSRCERRHCIALYVEDSHAISLTPHRPGCVSIAALQSTYPWLPLHFRTSFWTSGLKLNSPSQRFRVVATLCIPSNRVHASQTHSMEIPAGAGMGRGLMFCCAGELCCGCPDLEARCIQGCAGERTACHLEIICTVLDIRTKRTRKQLYAEEHQSSCRASAFVFSFVS